MSIVAVALASARTAAVPEGGDWLTPPEAEVLAGLDVPKRAADWRLGRWVAKEAVGRALQAEGLAPRDVQVMAGPQGGPEARILAPGSWPQVTLSLSHSGGMGFAAAGMGAFRLGCDVEAIEPRSDAFVTDYLTEEERSWVLDGVGRRELRTNLVWSAKESALKALGEGLRLDTRSVRVTAEDAADLHGWGTLRVASEHGHRLSGCWRASQGFVWTVVADAALALLLAPGGV